MQQDEISWSIVKLPSSGVWLIPIQVPTMGIEQCQRSKRLWRLVLRSALGRRPDEEPLPLQRNDGEGIQEYEFLVPLPALVLPDGGEYDELMITNLHSKSCIDDDVATGDNTIHGLNTSQTMTDSKTTLPVLCI